MSHAKEQRKKKHIKRKEEFPPEDRKLFQFLVDYPLDPIEKIAKMMGKTNLSMFFRQLNIFYDRYQCSNQIQILNWPLLGLKSFFILTKNAIDHPYVIRQYEMLADTPMFLTQWVTPDLDQARSLFPEIYPITQIYRPTNNIRLLYDDERNIAFVDKWLLDLKEIMVEGEMGDIMYEQDELPKDIPRVNKNLLEEIREIYTRNKSGRFDTRLSRQINLINTLKGFLSLYLDIQIPNMIDYILIIDEIINPKLFVGGFIGRFPLLELYESPNALICRFQIPEPHYSKFNLILYTHLREICTPYIWLLLKDMRRFQLHEQWNENNWVPFTIKTRIK